MDFVWISEEWAIISLYSVNWLVFITEIGSVFCAAGPGSLNKRDYVSSLKGSSSQARLLYCFSHIHFVMYADRPDKSHYLIQILQTAMWKDTAFSAAKILINLNKHVILVYHIKVAKLTNFTASFSRLFYNDRWEIRHFSQTYMEFFLATYDKVGLGQVFLPNLRLFPVSVIPPMLSILM